MAYWLEDNSVYPGRQRATSCRAGCRSGLRSVFAINSVLVRLTVELTAIGTARRTGAAYPTRADRTREIAQEG